MDRLLIVINNLSAEYAVTFTAIGVGAAASKVRRCQGLDGLQSFFCQIGLRGSTVHSLTDELERDGSASTRISLPEEKLDLF